MAERFSLIHQRAHLGPQDAAALAKLLADLLGQRVRESSDEEGRQMGGGDVAQDFSGKSDRVARLGELVQLAAILVLSDFGG